MTDRELMQLALYALEYIHTETTEDEDELIHGAIKSLRARLAQPELMPCSVRFPRHTPKHGEDWIIDPAFLLRVYHSIDPDAHYGFIPTMEEIETALLALEVIPSNLYTTPPQRKPLTDEQIDAVMPQPTEFGIVQPPWNGLDITILRAMARAIEAAHGITGEKK